MSVHKKETNGIAILSSNRQNFTFPDKIYTHLDSLMFIRSRNFFLR